MVPTVIVSQPETGVTVGKSEPMQVGEVCGRLTAVRFHHSDKRHRKYWVCRCECGKEIITHTGSLRSGNTKSCGCLATELRKARRISPQHSDVTAVMLGYKRHAKGRGYAWNLTRQQVQAVIFRPCHYCGAEPGNVKTTKNSLSPLRYSGIDRVDNTRGYEAGNVVPCCTVCNRAKGTMSTTEFAAWAERLHAMAETWSPLLGSIVR